MMPEWNVNIVALIVALVAMQILGFLWYGPLFGKIWMRSIGKTQEELGSAGSSIAVSMISHAVAAVALAWLIGATSQPDLVTGISYGLIVAVGFVATSSLVKSAFEDTNSTVAALSIAYNLVGYAIMGAILGAWR